MVVANGRSVKISGGETSSSIWLALCLVSDWYIRTFDRYLVFMLSHHFLYNCFLCFFLAVVAQAWAEHDGLYRTFVEIELNIRDYESGVSPVLYMDFSGYPRTDGLPFRARSSLV